MYIKWWIILSYWIKMALILVHKDWAKIMAENTKNDKKKWSKGPVCRKGYDYTIVFHPGSQTDMAKISTKLDSPWFEKFVLTNETIPGMRGAGNKGEWWMGWIQV
jgi:hypothetical protein